MKNSTYKVYLFTFLGLCVFLFCGFQFYHYLRVKFAKIEVTLVENRTIEFASKKRVSEYIESINGEIIDDFWIDTTKALGEQKVTFQFINEQKIKLNYTFLVDIVDTTPPLVWLSGSYSIVKGSEDNLTKNILCGDDYDKNPHCYIEGEYDLDQVGTYPLVFHAEDSSGNRTEKEFNLKVYEKSIHTAPSIPHYLSFSEVYKTYKTPSNRIGIDISKWQGDIDFEKVKKAGVEFVIIRVGTTKGIGGEFVLDEKFVANIQGASEVGLPVGVYFYSYANHRMQAEKEAKWVISQIKDYSLQLPVVFDFEDWTHFNDYQLSFYELSMVANTFLETVENSGYQGMLYSSKTYLENIWHSLNYETWLAHYTSKTNYQGKYKMWQLSNIGKVDGISGAVDLDILYD